MAKDLHRCPWTADDKLMIEYHDTEWGTPVHDDAVHFEYLLLDLFQAGLSWKTILHKRENFRQAFDGFDYKKIATYGPAKIESLMKDKGIVRNRMKIESIINNAARFIEIQHEYGSFDRYIWQFTDYKTIQNNWQQMQDIPATSPGSDRMSRDLKKRGFRFIGSTTCYAYMQGAGMVNDHITGCFRHKELSARK
ncbi:MAG: DNA-3-methyladenine glycosylase I [Bacteroidales bacterium]